MKKIKTFEDACRALKIEAVLPDFSNTPERLHKSMLAHYQLVIIAEALNAGWTPDWTDYNLKYYPWWNMDGEFSLNLVSYYYQRTHVSSGLCFKSRSIAEYAVKKFFQLYKDYYTL